MNGPKVSASSCSVVARVIETNITSFPIGKALCKNQAFAVSSPLTVACLATRQVLRIMDPKDLVRCDTAPQKLRSCNPQSRMYCPRMRTGEFTNKPLLVKPYGVILDSKPVQFTWLQVNGADRYRVVTKGVASSKTMQFTSNLETQLNLPAGTIAVAVQGMRGDEVIGSTVTTFDVLGNAASGQLAEKLQIIDGFVASPQEKVLLKLSIFESKNLVNDAILFLEQNQSLRKRPILMRTLADLYLEVGQLDASKKYYESAMALAKQQNDRIEYIKAQEGERTVSTWLLPRPNEQRS